LDANEVIVNEASKVVGGTRRTRVHVDAERMVNVRRNDRYHHDGEK